MAEADTLSARFEQGPILQSDRQVGKVGLYAFRHLPTKGKCLIWPARQSETSCRGGQRPELFYTETS